MPTDFLDELAWRGLLHQATDEAALRQHLSSVARRAYIGFDPTADSLTIGNLVTIMLLVRFQLCGHEPMVVMGGGTGLIGDPSGKSAERQLLTEERVRANVDAQREIFERVFTNAARLAGREPRVPAIVNNLDWLGKLGYLEALRDVGKHFSVNMMIQKESVRERLHGRDQGISYTEFSYMILQAYDYFVLHRDRGITLQMGGSDQWGNIVAGADLIRRLGAPAEHRRSSADMSDSPSATKPPAVFGLTTPLITKADGSKFGKTESGAIWLTAGSGPARTSPYAFYQFWLNAADADLPRFIRTFTVFSRERTEELLAAHEREPGAREAHRALALHMTELLHGPEEAAHAEAAAKALFSGDIAGLPAATLDEVFANVPGSEHEKSQLSGQGLPAVDLLMLTTLVKSKREAREHLGAGAVTVNGRPLGPEDSLTAADLLHGSLLALRRGKKAWHLTRWK